MIGIDKEYDIHHQHSLRNIIIGILNNLKIKLKEEYTGEEIIKIKNECNRIHKEYPLGVCLNKNLHVLFHQKYSKKECTQNQLKEFVKRYFNKEFDNELDEKYKSINSQTNYEEAMKRIVSFITDEIKEGEV